MPFPDDDDIDDITESYIDTVEQDEHGTDDLPTYENLAEHSNPNSRFGRWRGWIEKRAAERYADVTPEEHERRRARGWGNPEPAPLADQPVQELQEFLQEDGPRSTPIKALHIQINTEASEVSYDLPAEDESQNLSAVDSPPPPSELLTPTHLQLHNFGSRFIPHSDSAIRCILPLQSDRLILIGHDSGLSVLNMFPQEWAENGLVQKGHGEAHARPIWTGEAVYQMSILESSETAEGTPKGVVLALVGPDNDPYSSTSKDQEPIRTLRMYNLASLVSLAKWTIAQDGVRPLDLHRPHDWNIQLTPHKKHRQASSLTKGIRNLIIESQHTRESQPVPYQPSVSSSSAANAERNSLQPRSSIGSCTEWDVVDDLPLRWATDFVPLATPGSRLVSTSVSSYALFQDGTQGSRALLAIATKSNIFLYETPKGERAFHFTKEFYTPVQARSIVFIHQSVQDLTRSSSEPSTSHVVSSPSPGYGHIRVASTESSFNLRTSRSTIVPLVNLDYGTQLALFVIFDRKAGIIRIADAAVTEVDLYDNNPNTSLPLGRDALSALSPSSSRRSRLSHDYGSHYLRELKGVWVPPSKIEIPALPQFVSGTGVTSARSLFFLTRGKQTHILPYPLPPSIPTTRPLHIVTWECRPSSVIPRLCQPPATPPSMPFLQLVGFGEDGVEVQEIPLILIFGSDTGKGKQVCPQAVSFIGETGFLAIGGHWHRPLASLQQLIRTSSVMSNASLESLETDELMSRLKADQGIYGWLRKGFEDWRIFWVGGDSYVGRNI